MEEGLQKSPGNSADAKADDGKKCCKDNGLVPPNGHIRTHKEKAHGQNTNSKRHEKARNDKNISTHGNGIHILAKEHTKEDAYNKNRQEKTDTVKC